MQTKPFQRDTNKRQIVSTDLLFQLFLLYRILTLKAFPTHDIPIKMTITSWWYFNLNVYRVHRHHRRSNSGKKGPDHDLCYFL